MAKAQPEDLTPVAPGEILADKYRVERVIGVGGMGVVVAATHVELEEPRALKFMLRKYSDDAEAAARFVREAKAAARLKSEHVGAIYDIGRLASGQPYMVMEYLAGDDLRAILEREGQLPIEQAVDYTLQALCGLAEAHTAGIVHRDLKPANLFVTQGTDGLPRVKIVDFGISKLTGATAQPIAAKTQTAALLGSPHYMSPEQLACARLVDARTDIWSVGIMLYEMLTGKLPFDGPSVTAVTVVVVQKDPPKPSGLRPEIAPALEAAVLRCLAKDPDDRFPDVAALAEALAPFGSDAGRSLVEHVKRVQQAARPSAEAAPAATPPPATEAKDAAAPAEPAADAPSPDAPAAEERGTDHPSAEEHEDDAGAADGRVVGTESVWEHGDEAAAEAGQRRRFPPWAGYLLATVVAFAAGALVVFRGCFGAGPPAADASRESQPRPTLEVSATAAGGGAPADAGTGASLLPEAGSEAAESGDAASPDSADAASEEPADAAPAPDAGRPGHRHRAQPEDIYEGEDRAPKPKRKRPSVGPFWVPRDL
jgi:eukaryotic-like serine/threonine-protein kinase